MCLCLSSAWERHFFSSSQLYQKKKKKVSARFCAWVRRTPRSQCQEKLPSEINISKLLICVAFMQPNLMPNLMKLHLLHLWATENDIIVLANCFAFLSAALCLTHSIARPPMWGPVMIFLKKTRQQKLHATDLSDMKVFQLAWKTLWSHPKLFYGINSIIQWCMRDNNIWLYEFISALTTSTIVNCTSSITILLYRTSPFLTLVLSP